MLRALLRGTGTLVLAAAIAACGDGDNNNVDVVVSTIDFGHTDCGTTAIPRVLTVTNKTSNAFNFTIELAAGADSLYEVIPSSGAVLPLSQVSVMVHSRPIPQTADVADNAFGETLTVTTDMDGDSPHTVAITQTARGAVFEVSTDTVNLATPQQLGTTVATPVMITNVGNVPATLTAASTAVSVSVAESGQSVAPGAAIAAMVNFSPGANAIETQTLTLTATDAPVCGSPATITVSGSGTAQGLAAYAVPASTAARPRNTGGASTLCVKTTTNTVACAGANANGMRGASDEYLAALEPPSGKGGGGSTGGGLPILDLVNVVQTKDGFVSDVVDLVSGVGFYCARTTNGDVWCWGDYNGLGNRVDPSEGRLNPQAVKVWTGAGSISAGYLYRCMTKATDGALQCRTQRAATNSPVSTLGWKTSNAVQVANNGGNAFARLMDGTVMTFGLNGSGERGLDEDANSIIDNAPGNVIPDLTDVAQVVAGGRGVNRSHRFVCARKTDESVWCWGKNRHGQLGDGTTTNQSVPVQVVDTTDAPIAATQLTAGRAHVCAIVDGNVACWGRGEEGEIGSGNTSENVVKAELVAPALTGVTAIEAAGTRATCATLTSGAVRCWGQFASGTYTAPEPVFAFEP